MGSQTLASIVSYRLMGASTGFAAFQRSERDPPGEPLVAGPGGRVNRRGPAAQGMNNLHHIYIIQESALRRVILPGKPGLTEPTPKASGLPQPQRFRPTSRLSHLHRALH